MSDIVKLVLILAIALCMASPVYAAELLTNGDFDDDDGLGAHQGFAGGVPGWDMMGTGDFWQHADPGYHRGSYAIAMYTQGTGLVQVVSAVPDDFFTMSGSMIYSEFDEPLEEGTLALRLEFWDDAYPDGVLLELITVGTLSSDDPPDVWKDVQALGLAPAGTSEVRVVCDYYGLFVGKGHFDDISLVDENSTGQAGAPLPADGAIVEASTTTEVKWVNAVGTGPTEVEVLFAKDGDPNSTILTRQVVSSWVGLASLPSLDEDSDYHWLVRYYDDSGDTTPETVLWSTFNTGNAPPQVNLVDQYVWLNMDDGDGDPCKLSLDINPNITDDGKSLPLTYLWEGVFADSLVPSIEIDPNDTETTTAVFYALGHWTIQLTVDDGQWQAQGVSDIYVYATPCEAAQGDPMDEALIGDADGDCDGDLGDLAVVASSWLDCMSEKLGCTP